MKTILCFGDSNTWGYNPVTKERFSQELRWTGVLRRELGLGYEVIEEGLNGRTTVCEDPIDPHKNGRSYFIPCLDSHRPLDLVAIFLGTNNLKKRFSQSAYDIAEGVADLIEIAQKSGAGLAGAAPKILVMAPPPVAKLSEFAEMFEGAELKSMKLGQHYRRVAGQYSCEFLDTSEVIVSSDVDGIHFDPGEHQKLGRSVAGLLKRILG